MRFTGHFESEILAPSVTRRTRRSGALGRRSRFAARPLRWSDLDRLLELADGPAPCQISIPEPVIGGSLRPPWSGLLNRESTEKAWCGPSLDIGTAIA
jgi:hypothetical protein